VPHFEERFTVNATPETVWAFLLDPKRLASCIPGCDDLEIVDERVYRLRLTVKVGFLSTRQDVRMEIVEADPPRRLISEGRGEDARLGSRVEVRSSLELSPADDGATTVAYASDVTVLGRLGSIGDAVMKVKAKELAGTFAHNVKAALESKEASSPIPSPPSGERAG
jgi:carbon monoxide dehydrogenase subunit G